MGMLMPASRNHNYWVGRLQAGTQWDNVAGDLASYAAGVDLQWRGGSTLGLTAGYQVADCEEDVIGCDSHPLFGARGRFNIITGGPTVAAIIGDNSATTTLGGEIGFGYAPNALGEQNACAIDLGMPVSLSLFQRIRVLSFLTPGIAWDVRCPVNGTVGTDHGTGTVVLLAGGAIKGGRVIADWPGLKPAQLYEQRDLAPTSDVRAVLKGLLADQFGLSAAVLGDKVFPESAAVKPMRDLVA